MNLIKVDFAHIWQKPFSNNNKRETSNVYQIYLRTDCKSAINQGHFNGLFSILLYMNFIYNQSQLCPSAYLLKTVVEYYNIIISLKHQMYLQIDSKSAIDQELHNKVNFPYISHATYYVTTNVEC